MQIQKAGAFYDGSTGALSGASVRSSLRTLRETADIYVDQAAVEEMDDQVAYSVEMHDAVGDGVAGGLCFGISRIWPGKVGDEYFMTKGHFHQRRETAEYYWGIAGNGLLLLMDEARQVRAEEVRAGSLHYIPGHVAHRLINTGSEQLVVGACWPSDAGHDYNTIARDGFAVRVVERDGRPFLIP